MGSFTIASRLGELPLRTLHLIIHGEVRAMRGPKLKDGKKPGSADRNERDVARMDHDAQKRRDKQIQQGAQEQDKQARREMGVEHPGRVLP
jgi:hypothetical protein